MRNGFRVIDADAHFYEPADIWDKYIEKKYYQSPAPCGQSPWQISI